MRASRLVGACSSFLLHGLFLLALVSATATAPKPPPKPADNEVAKLWGAADSALVPVRALTDVEGIQGFSRCPDESYVGIGIRAMPILERVIEVGENTPGKRAGILVSDVILNYEDLNTESYVEGQLLKLKILREGKTIELTVKIARICVEKEKT